MERSELKQEIRLLQEMNDALRRENGELKEEKLNYGAEMKSICERQKNELEEALRDIARLRKEHSDYEREMTAAVERVREELIREGKMHRRWLPRIHGPFHSLEECYLAHRDGLISDEELQSYGFNCGIKGWYNFTKEALLTVTAVGTCLEYFTTVLPLLPGVTSVSFPDLGQYTKHEDLFTMIGGGSVGEFLTTVEDLLPAPKLIWGFYQYYYEYYIAYMEAPISRELLTAFCYGRGTNYLWVGTSDQLTASVDLAHYCEVMLPLLSKVTRIEVGPEVDNIDWCATLPERITTVSFVGCSEIEDFTPLLAMVGLRQVVYNKSTNPSFQSIIDQLRNKGVTVEEL
ncbi:hypothetical protein AGDE_15296 [Angomonas deanei]|nr:hypothetical protein AGDE_15296 [Angomonas deanei]|eukprot:EPY19320.1 hypothetical protein AGDE_15296 [Angomonas deanei]